MSDIKLAICRLAEGQVLDRHQAYHLFSDFISGKASGAQIGALLMALRLRGETFQEIVGATEAMRAAMIPVNAPTEAVDIVGTGGDGAGTYNISTCAAFIVAGAGMPVAKHGNRAVSSKTGAADVLASLGVELGQTSAAVERCLAIAGIGFMFSPNHHPALKHITATRLDLATRTIFNLMGPLLNPARVKRHLIGVYGRQWLEPLARALRELGSERAMIVHGADGLDEITTTGTTFVTMLRHGHISSFELTPEMVGLRRALSSDLKGGNGQTNATALRQVLQGQPGAYRDIAIFNAAAALIAGGMTEDWQSAMQAAGASIDDGKALASLERLIVVSRQPDVLTYSPASPDDVGRTNMSLSAASPGSAP